MFYGRARKGPLAVSITAILMVTVLQQGYATEPQSVAVVPPAPKFKRTPHYIKPEKRDQLVAKAKARTVAAQLPPNVTPEQHRQLIEKIQQVKAVATTKRGDVGPEKTMSALYFAFLINNGEETGSSALRVTFIQLIAQRVSCILVNQFLFDQFIETYNNFKNDHKDLASQIDATLTKIALLEPGDPKLAEKIDMMRYANISSFLHQGDIPNQTYLALANFDKNWLVYQNKDAHDKAYDMYILVPKEYAKKHCKKDSNLDIKDFDTLGLNSKNIGNEITTQVLGKTNKTNPTCRDEIFSKEVVRVITQSLSCFTSDNTTLRLGYFVGHGMAKKSIMGIDEPNAFSLLKGIGKYLNYVHLTTCFGGGAHREQIEQLLQHDTPFRGDVVMSIEGVSDEPTTSLFPIYEETMDHFSTTDLRGLSLFPYYMQMRFDKFFQGLTHYFNGNPINLMDDVFVHIAGTTLPIKNAIYFYIPGSAQGFSLEDFIKKPILKVLGQVEAKVLARERNKKITLGKDTKGLVVYPNFVDTEIELTGVDESFSIRSGVGGDTITFFKKITITPESKIKTDSELFKFIKKLFYPDYITYNVDYLIGSLIFVWPNLPLLEI